MENNVRFLSGYARKWGDDIEETRTVEFVISTSDKDRHNTVLNHAGWNLENYDRNPIVGYQHNVYGDDFCSKPDPDDIIGTSRVFVEDKNLIGAVTFEPAEENALAEKIFRKVLRGTLRSASVGFLPVPDEKGKDGYYGKEDDEEHRGGIKETFYYVGQELVEWSIVNIPSNTKAQAKAVRAYTANALMFLKKELSIPFADIEAMRVGDVVAMIEDPEKKQIKDRSSMIRELVTEALGDKFNNEEIEKLTVKGLLNTLRGDEAAGVEHADTGAKVDTEAREKRLNQNKEINNYLKLAEEHNNVEKEI